MQSALVRFDDFIEMIPADLSLPRAVTGLAYPAVVSRPSGRMWVFPKSSGLQHFRCESPSADRPFCHVDGRHCTPAVV